MASRTVGAEQTLAFIEASVPPCSLLEVGCGDGELAQRLMEKNFRVLAVDTDPDAVANARDRGVDVTCADFSGFECPFVETVLFSRSLHHMEDPAAAVRYAGKLLANDGHLLVEDFGHELVTEPAATWLYDVMSFAAGLCGIDYDEVSDPLGTWQAEHPHDHVHPGHILEDAIRQVCTTVARQSAPYLYRYVGDLDASHEMVQHVTAAVLHWENRLINRGALPAVGLRWHSRTGK